MLTPYYFQEYSQGLCYYLLKGTISLAVIDIIVKPITLTDVR